VKLLFDQNLSYRLVERLSDLYPASNHVRMVGLDKADDSLVWEYAKDHGYAIVSKDEDLHQRSFVFGPPPKVVWLRLGNCDTNAIEDALRGNRDRLAEFAGQREHAFLIVSAAPTQLDSNE
jgi:predicted nuclease of predicted toxin-antitoxin system